MNGEGGWPEGAWWPNAVAIVLLARTEAQRAWAAATAVRLAREMARERSRIVVVDLHAAGRSSGIRLDLPELPEGISDVLLHGATFTQVARKPESEQFYYVGLGTAPPPPEELLSNPRWEKLARRFRELEAHLLVCVSADDWVDAGPIPGLDSAIIVNGVGEEIETPPDTTVMAELTAPVEIREGMPPAWEPGGAPQPVGAGGPGYDEDEPAAPGSGAGFSRRLPRERRPLIAFAGGVLVLLLGFFWAIGTRGGSASADRVEAAAGDGEVSRVVEASNEVGGRATAAVALPYSVLIASYSAFEDALARQRRWARPDVHLYVAPTVVRDVVYYRVFAGILPTREEAVALMHSLVDAGIKDTVRNWDVRPAHLAFEFEVFGDRERASAMVEELSTRGIPAYIVQYIDGTDGEIRYRVYAGGYEKPEDARPLERQIAGSQLDAELVERVGSIPR